MMLSRLISYNTPFSSPLTLFYYYCHRSIPQIPFISSYPSLRNGKIWKSNGVVTAPQCQTMNTASYRTSTDSVWPKMHSPGTPDPSSFLFFSFPSSSLSHLSIQSFIFQSIILESNILLTHERGTEDAHNLDGVSLAKLWTSLECAFDDLDAHGLDAKSTVSTQKPYLLHWIMLIFWKTSNHTRPEPVSPRRLDDRFGCSAGKPDVTTFWIIPQQISTMGAHAQYKEAEKKFWKKKEEYKALTSTSKKFHAACALYNKADKWVLKRSCIEFRFQSSHTFLWGWYLVRLFPVGSFHYSNSVSISPYILELYYHRYDTGSSNCVMKNERSLRRTLSMI